MQTSWDRIWNDLTGYKTSALLFAALELHIFDYTEDWIGIEELAHKLKVQPERLQILLSVLCSSGFIREGDKLYKNTDSSSTYLTSTSSEYIGSITRLEKYIYENFVTPDRIVASLQDDRLARADHPSFLHQLADSTFQSSYADVVYSHGTLLKIIRLLRGLIRDNPAPITVEIGQTGEKMSQYVQRFFIHAKSYSFERLSKVQEVPDQLLGSVDAATVHNVIHYVDNKEWETYVAQLSVLLKRGGYLLIQDFFVDHLREAGLETMKEHLLLDWLTHGGIEHLSVDTLLDCMRTNGFDIEEMKNEGNAGSLLLFSKKG